MSPVQKVVTAAMALTITLTGAVLATAPMTFAGSRWVASSTRSWSPSHRQLMLPEQTDLKDLERTGIHLAQS